MEQFRTVIQRFQRQMYVYCKLLLNDKDQAEDAVQDIFIKSYQDINSYSPTVSFQAWLYKIAYHHCLNLNKKKANDRKLFHIFKELYRSTLQYHIDSSSELQDILDPLSMEEKHILLLRAVEEYSYDEIAEVMDLKPATIRKKYERLRKKLNNEHQPQEGGYIHESAFHKSRG
nr:sigma-70 family RNA polymerase sigma factor [Paenibacillus sp. 453mf]